MCIATTDLLMHVSPHMLGFPILFIASSVTVSIVIYIM